MTNEENERLNYLLDKEKVAPLDKEERYELEQLLSKDCQLEPERVQMDGKDLYCIQNNNITSDGTTFNVFVWSSTWPDENMLEELYNQEFREEYEDQYKEEFMTSSEVFVVYAYGE